MYHKGSIQSIFVSVLSVAVICLGTTSAFATFLKPVKIAEVLAVVDTGGNTTTLTITGKNFRVLSQIAFLKGTMENISVFLR